MRGTMLSTGRRLGRRCRLACLLSGCVFLPILPHFRRALLSMSSVLIRAGDDDTQLFLTDLIFIFEGNRAERPSPVDPSLRLINFDRYHVRPLASFPPLVLFSLTPDLSPFAENVPHCGRASTLPSPLCPRRSFRDPRLPQLPARGSQERSGRSIALYVPSFPCSFPLFLVVLTASFRSQIVSPSSSSRGNRLLRRPLLRRCTPRTAGRTDTTCSATGGTTAVDSFLPSFPLLRSPLLLSSHHPLIYYTSRL